MTALGNRNAFQLYLSNLLERPPERLSFVVFDVDDLKRINDQLGHHVGDQAIYIAAQCIRAAVDTFGSCYRIGGDEFAAVVTGKAVAKIPEILSRFTREVEIHWNMQLPSSGVSYGWSSASFSPKTPLTAERLSQLRAEADQSLYRLKQDRKEGKMDGPAV